jgi:hypothetical protein
LSFSLASGMLLALALAESNSIAAPFAAGHQRTILYQVRQGEWRQAITRWKAYPASAWWVSKGILTTHPASPPRGVQLCGNDSGHKYCNYLAVLYAPYRVTRKDYAVETRMRVFSHTAILATGAWLGLIFRFRIQQGYDAAVTPGVFGAWVSAGPGGFSAECSGGTSEETSLGMCASIDPLVPPSWRGYDPGTAWHIYRVEVRRNRYRLIIDGREIQAANDSRSDAQLGKRLGLFSLDTGIEIQSFTVSTLGAT